MQGGRKMWRALAVIALVAGMTGCHSAKAPTNENFTKALNTWYSTHDDCLFPNRIRFPYEVSTTDKSEAGAQGMDGLMSAGLLIRDEDKTIHINRYRLSAVGTRATNRFCFGHREVSSIESIGPETTVDGRPTHVVRYHYTLLDAPNWAKAEAVQKAFPAMATAIRGEAVGEEKLELTMAGWQRPE